MNLIDINLKLKNALQSGPSAHISLSPYGVAGFLEICHKILQEYIAYANYQLGDDKASHITPAELEKIDSVFKELTENFFPMAHTDTPLARLHIVNSEKARHVRHLFDNISSLRETCRQLEDEISGILPEITNP